MGLLCRRQFVLGRVLEGFRTLVEGERSGSGGRMVGGYAVEGG